MEKAKRSYTIRMMSRSNGIGIILWIYLIIKELSATNTQGPSNAVAEIGKQVKLNCTATAAIGYWYLSRNGVQADEVTITRVACTGVNSAFADHYAVESLGGGTTCNLIVSNITMGQAGVYRCQEGANQFLSILTVTDSSPVITVNNTHGTRTVVENEYVIFECALNHNGSVSPAPTLRPYFYWTDFNGQNVSSSYDLTTDNTAVSKKTVIAGRQNITSYACHVYLRLNLSTSPNYAVNTPMVSSSASSTAIEVLFSPSTPSVTSWTEVKTENGVECEVSVLTCNSTANPPPKYNWIDTKQSYQDAILSGKQILQRAEINRNYTCEAYNTIRNERHANSTTYKVTATENSTNNSYCISDETSPSWPTNDLHTTIIPAAVLGSYGLCNIMATILFFAYYNGKCDDKEMSTFKNKSKLNARFPWLQRMLPCMNESRENAGCTFLWVILFILMSILTGIIAFPILVAMVNCSRKHKNSKENSDTGVSNQPHSKTAGTPSTAAHGDFEDPYDEINTIRHDRKHTLEEPTSAENTKDAKKVFYTRVNPNLNTEEDIERYSVTLPS